jgi:hypothetical protein
LQVIDVRAVRIIDGRSDGDEVNVGAKPLIGSKRDRQHECGDRTDQDRHSGICCRTLHQHL